VILDVDGKDVLIALADLPAYMAAVGPRLSVDRETALAHLVEFALAVMGCGISTEVATPCFGVAFSPLVANDGNGDLEPAIQELRSDVRTLIAMSVRDPLMAKLKAHPGYLARAYTHRRYMLALAGVLQWVADREKAS
jgi:hypothetical protein